MPYSVSEPMTRMAPPAGSPPESPAGRAGHCRHRYWPVLGIVSMDLPGSCPALPWTMVRM